METNKMETRDIFPLLMSMSLPMVLSMLVQSLYNIIDSIYVSYLGTGALTAVSLASLPQNIVLSVAVGIGVGLLPSYRSVWGKRIRNGSNEARHNGDGTYADPLCTVCDLGPCDHRTIYRIIYKRNPR